MTRRLPRWCLLGLVACIGAASPASAQFALRSETLPVHDAGSAAPGELHGVVLDEDGTPLAGAVVSALGSSSVFAVSNREGRFGFRNLRPGAYLVRVYLDGYRPGRARSVQIVSDGRAITTVALSRRNAEDPPAVLPAGMGSLRDSPPVTPTAGKQGSVSDSQDASEVAWRLRHARRSVLKDSQAFIPGDDDGFVPAAGAPRSADRLATSLFADLSLNGQVHLLTTASFDRPQDLFSADADVPQPIAYLSLVAPAPGGEWAFRGAITQGDLASWILAGSFVRREGSRHAYEAGLSYSMQRYQGGNADALTAMRDGSRNVGAIYAHDTWTMSPRVRLSYGARLAEHDYLDDTPMLMSPRASVIVQPLLGDTLRFGATAFRRESAPGADEFLPAARGVALPPERTFSPIGQEFRAERLDHVELAAERRWRGDLVVGVRAFRQHVSDQMVTLFGVAMADAAPSIGHYYVGSGGDFEADGWGVSLSRTIGSGMHAAIDYTQVDATWLTWSPDAPSLAALTQSLLRTTERIHDLTGSVQSVVAPTSTRIVVMYKLNSAFPGRSPDAQAGTSARFNVQVNQSLPLVLLAGTGAQWEMLVAVSNLFRDELTNGSVYDELLVLKPPTRVVGGVTVRF